MKKNKQVDPVTTDSKIQDDTTTTTTTLSSSTINYHINSGNKIDTDNVANDPEVNEKESTMLTEFELQILNEAINYSGPIDYEALLYFCEEFLKTIEAYELENIDTATDTKKIDSVDVIIDDKKTVNENTAAPLIINNDGKSFNNIKKPLLSNKFDNGQDGTEIKVKPIPLVSGFSLETTPTPIDSKIEKYVSLKMTNSETDISITTAAQEKNMSNKTNTAVTRVASSTVLSNKDTTVDVQSSLGHDTMEINDVKIEDELMKYNDETQDVVSSDAREADTEELDNF